MAIQYDKDTGLAVLLATDASNKFPLVQAYTTEDAYRLCQMPVSELRNDPAFRAYLDSRKPSDLEKIEANLNKLIDETPGLRILVLYSSSRKELWPKGLTSGNVQKMSNLYLPENFGHPVIIAEVIPDGPMCHENKYSCFFRLISGLFPFPGAEKKERFGIEKASWEDLKFDAISRRFPSMENKIPAIYFSDDVGVVDFNIQTMNELLEKSHQGVFTDCDYDCVLIKPI